MSNKQRTLKFKNIINEMTPRKKWCHISLLILTIVSLALCLWGAIQLTSIKNEQLLFLKSLSSPELEALFAKHGKGWEAKGLEAFSWYLSSLDPLGSVSYWFAGIFGLTTAPLIIYYLSALVIIFFPKKPKKKKVDKKVVKNGIK
ncbi:MAG: hypothetical protein ACRC4M_00310 [Mycoplasma sp.]